MRRLRTGILIAAWVASGATAKDLPGVDETTKTIRVNLYDEPKTLDPQLAADTVATMILGHVGEGLARLDPAGKPVPAQAESWQVKDATHYVFTLRKDAQWSDGKPVVAADFLHGWTRALDPELASESAFLLFAVKNARAIKAGTMPKTALAVKAVDERTLEVELERPTEYFLRLLNLSVYYPARRDAPKAHVGNGPFVIAAWEHDKSMTLRKNERYWNKDEIAVEVLDFPMLLRDKTAEFHMFREGKLALVWSLSKELLPEVAAAGLPMRKYNYGSVSFFQFNVRRPLFAEKHLRKAFQLALNREEFVGMVHGIPGSKPIYGIVPEYMPGVTKRYGEEFPLAFPDAQVDAAKAELELAKKALKLDKLPPIQLLASDTDDMRRDAAYFAKYFKEKLGLELVPEHQSFKTRLQRSERGEFDLVLSGWGPDYLDAMTFADLHTSWNENNNSGWSSKDYDGAIERAMRATDAKTRLEAIAAAERILVEEAPVIPYLQSFRVYVQDPRVVGVVRRTVGADPDFYYAKFAGPVAKK